MRRLGPTMQTGRIASWLKHEGDEVREGELLLVVETEKVTVDVNSPATGVLRKIVVGEGEECSVGSTIAFIGTPEEPIEETTSTVAKEAVPTSIVRADQEALAPEGKILISPRAKKLADELRVDIAAVQGTGPGGRIVREDVENYLKTTEATGAPKLKEVVELSDMRKKITERLLKSYSSAIHVTVVRQIDFSELAEFRKEKSKEVTLSYTDLLVKAAALALRRHPIVNSALDGDHVKVFQEINVGIAVALEEGLTVPVIKNADRKTLIEVAKENRLLIEKARRGTLSLDDISGGTFTITNLGSLGVDFFTPIISPPQTAIMGVGRVKEIPASDNGVIRTRLCAHIGLTFDHRVIDGAVAASFLTTLDEILQSPSILNQSS